MLRLTARGKINWTLDIVGTRPDGYHLMDMLMSTVTLADTLEIAPSDALALSVQDAMGQGKPSLSVPSSDDNLALRAARALQKATGCQKGASLRLIKRIPVGGGMGGGSADAAAALLGLCHLWCLSLGDRQLKDLALSLGADVPFLLRGGLARVSGIGETLEALPFPRPCALAWVQPCEGLSTPEIFKGFDNLDSPMLLRPQTEEAQRALLAGDLPALGRAMGNVMEPVSIHKRPEIREAIRELERLGALRAMMTGSGSVVYGVFGEEETARRAADSLQSRWKNAGYTETAAQSIVFEQAD